MLLRKKKKTEDELDACNNVGWFRNNYAEWKQPEIKISLKYSKNFKVIYGDKKQNKTKQVFPMDRVRQGRDGKKEIKKGNEEICRGHGYVNFLSQPLEL